MVVYHYDRLGNLESGVTLDLRHPLQNEIGLHPEIKPNFFPEGLSRHGLHYFSDWIEKIELAVFSDKLTFYNMSVTLRDLELIFELARRAMFPKMPSRFQSLFAVGSPDEMSRWPEMKDPNGELSGKLFEIDTHHAFCFDASYLLGGTYISCEPCTQDTQTTRPPLNISFSPALVIEQACNYWGQKLSSSPRMEYIVSLPTQVGREVDFL